MTSYRSSSDETTTTSDALTWNHSSPAYRGIGNTMIVPMSPLAEGSRRQLQEISDSLSPLCKEENSGVVEWKRLRLNIDTVIENLRDNEYRKFQHEFLHDAIIPYLKGMTNRWVLDVNRFNQIENLLDTIITEQNELTQRQHPAVLLLEIERIKDQIESKKQMFRSHLGTNLSKILNHQWQPMLRDMRRGLTSIGVRLLGLGLIEVMGRPLIVLYPLGIGIMEIVEIVKLIDAKKNISMKNYMELLKCACYLWGTWQLLAITTTYASIGWLCLLIGVIFLILTKDDSLIKYATPFLAPLLVLLDKLSFSVEKLQDKLVESLEGSGNNNSSNSNSVDGDIGNENISSSSSTLRHRQRRTNSNVNSCSAYGM